MFVKQAKKNLGLLRKSYWTAGLYYLQAAECYKNAGEKDKAYKYSREAIKCLEKYWSGTNDMVLPDLEKALAMAYFLAPKRARGKLREKAFNIYVYHARKLENSGNYLGAAEKYHAAIQFASSGAVARETILRAISILEKALEKEHIVKNRTLAEKIEKKIEELKKLVPPEPTEVEHVEVEAKYRYILELDIYPEAMKGVYRSFSEEFPMPIKDLRKVKRRGVEILSFSVPGYPVYVEIGYSGSSCKVEINSASFLFALEIAGNIKYFLDINGAIKEIKSEEVTGKPDRGDIAKFLKDLLKNAKAKESARRIAHLLDSLRVVFSKDKRLRKYVEDLGSLSKELLDLYVGEQGLASVDSKRIIALLEGIMADLSRR